MSNHDGQHKHHILSPALGLKVWLCLIALTVVTVAISRVDFGILNFPIAMAVASVKALLVVAFFMGLKYDSNENRVIFGGGLIFVAIFIILTSADLFFRPAGSVVTGPILAEVKSQASTLKEPWLATDALKARGKELYTVNCMTCHGAEGKGDGPAAAALNPKPRNFSVADGWKAGRKATEIFVTLTKGLGGMPAFAALPEDDRWALTHHVHTLGPAAPAVGPEDIKKVTSAAGSKEIPVEAAIQLIATDSKKN